MIATVGALILVAAVAAILAGAVWHQRSRARLAEAETRRLRVMVGQTAHLAAWALRGQPAQPPAEPRPQRSRHLRAVQGVLWPAALAGLVEAARRHPARVGAALAATTLAGLVALPLIAPGDPQPSRPDPPPAAAPPVVRFPDLPVPEPTPELEPGPEAGVPGPAPAEQPTMERVAVVQSEPSAAQPPVDQPQPVPAPAPEPSPEPPAPSPAPPPDLEPDPEPAPEPAPPEDGGDDPALLCVDVRLLGLDVCLP